MPFQYRIYAPAKSEHSVYFGAYTYFLNFGWNEIDGGGGQACRGLQIFHDASPQNNHDLLIHDNYIHDTTCDAINLNAFDATCGPVQVFNNLIVKAGKGISDIIADPPGGGGNNAAIYMSGSGTPGAASGAACSAQRDELQVFNNTIVNSGITGARATLQWPSARGAITRGYDFYDASTQLILANNILIQPAGTGSPYYAAYQSTTANTIADANLCYGVGACPASFADSTTADPKFVSEAPGYAATDYRLQSTSPAIRQSTQTPVAVADQDGQPQSIPYTIGAYGQASSADSSLSADFTLAATPSGATVGRGQAATFVLTLTPQGQFNGPVTLSCVGLPAFAACTFSPAALTPTNGPTSAVVTIATSQIATGALRGRIRPVEPSYSWLPALGAVATAVSRRRPRKSKVALALLALLLSLTIACGGGQRSVSAPSAPEASAPAWTGDVQVIATAMLSGGPGLSHSTMLTLTVR